MGFKDQRLVYNKRPLWVGSLEHILLENILSSVSKVASGKLNEEVVGQYQIAGSREDSLVF